MRRVLGIFAIVIFGAAAAVLVSRTVHDPAAEAHTPADPIAPLHDPVITKENARHGTRAWKLSATGHRSGGIEGYASHVSVEPGGSLEVKVRARAPSFTAQIFRMGWYHGMGGRLILRIPRTKGDRQRSCDVVGTRAMIRCDWRTSFDFIVTKFWVSGVYMIKLHASDGSESYVPFTVREAIPRASIIVQSAVTTWQAYNTWEGRDLYRGPCRAHTVITIPNPSPAASTTPPPRATKSATPNPSASPSPSPSSSGGILPTPAAAVSFSPAPQPSQEPTESAPQQVEVGGHGVCFDTRSRAVSFDRPYRWPGGGNFFRFEYPMVSWLESRGYPVAYGTSIDVQSGSLFMSKRKVFLSLGHDEYYSTAMRRALERALAHGTSLAFFGANAMYRHIRFEDGVDQPNRVEVNYKSVREDPMRTVNASETTGEWRNAPLDQPEQTLLGAQYTGCDRARGAWTPTGQPSWLFRGTGLGDGDRIANLVGYEVDRYFPSVKHPASVVMVSRSPVRCYGYSVESNSTFYVAASRAAVFDAGTIWWDCAFGPGCTGHPPDDRLERLTDNLVRAMLTRRFA